MVLVQSEDQRKNRIKDKRLRKNFGIDLLEHERRRSEQNNRCKICGREFIKSPHVDHIHFKIRTERTENGQWCATAYHEQFGWEASVSWEKTKKAAIEKVRAIAMPRSIRGLLCSQCNRGLGHLEDPRFFHGNPDLIIKAAEYLRGGFKTIQT